MKNHDLKLLQIKNIISLLNQSLVNYLNIYYKSLILEDNKYIIDYFTEMRNIHNHLEICLLNIILIIIQNIYNDFDRNN